MNQMLRFLLLFVLFASNLKAQVTTSNISGVVKQLNSAPLVGATIKATHLPTGTAYFSKTTQGGRYFLGNVQSGGPYLLEVSFVGFQTNKLEDLNLQLGETGKYDFTLTDKAEELKLTAVVTGRKNPQSIAKGGMETIIGADKLENAPTVGRQLADFVRLTPQTRITTNGGISIAGQNNRYNQIMFDGAVNNDVFGLSETGTNGGQTGSSPISIDAIESFQVGVSPYDVSLGNFTGGAINAITKSGTNKTKGSAYFINRNEQFAGKTPTGDKVNATRLPNFNNNIFGATVGGAITKNKLFYFFSFEREDGERPQPFDPTTFRDPKFQDTIRLIREKLATYGYDPGDWQNIPDIIKSSKLTGKITWNINKKNRLNVSFRYTNSERANTSPSTTTRINFFNNGYNFPSATSSTSVELNSALTAKASNKLLLTYTHVNDDRGALGGNFPRVTLNSTNGTSYVFGTEEFSTGNQLIQDNAALFDEFKYSIGKNHQIKAGLDVEFSHSYNVFIRQAFGSYTYNLAANWLFDNDPTAYNRSFSLVDDKVGDGSAAAAVFNTIRMGAFLGDQWDVTNNFQVNFGVRMDNYEFLTTPKEDTFFNNTALPQINNVYDTRSIRSGLRPQANLSLSPRIGFTFNVEPFKLRIKGGAGLFTGRVPLVWPGGAYNNTGVTIGGISVSLPNINFRPDPNNQYSAQDLGATVRIPSGQLDFIDPDFRLPKVLKTSFGIEKTLAKGWALKLDLLYQKNINEVDYQNVMGQPGLKTVFGQQTFWINSNRSYQTVDMNPNRSGVQNPYSEGVFIITNTRAPKGYSYNFTFTVDKAFHKGWSGNVIYSYGDSYAVFDGTSAQNNSNWRFMEATNGRNNLTRSRSDFAQLHRLNVYLSKKFSYAKNKLATTVTLFYNAQSGSAFSYTYNRSIIGDRNGNINETNDVIYVPTNFDDWNKYAESYVSNGLTITVQQQWDALDAYITKDKYLSGRRGQFAERNGAFLPMSHIVDGRIQQDFAFKAGAVKQRFAVVFDVFNLTNLINRTWGRFYRTPGIDQYQLISLEGFKTATNPLVPRLTYRNLTNRGSADIQDVTGTGYNASRWRGQLTVRYYFN